VIWTNFWSDGFHRWDSAKLLNRKSQKYGHRQSLSGIYCFHIDSGLGQKSYPFQPIIFFPDIASHGKEKV
jgi:hypothetical protein